MSEKSRKILGWVLTILIALLLFISSGSKIIGNESAFKQALTMGVKLGIYQILGIVELLSVLLFIMPRTGILGTLLLTAYFGGAIATLLQHHGNILFPSVLEGLIWITAALRFTELRQRLLYNIN